MQSMNKLQGCLKSFLASNSINYNGCRYIKRWVAPTLRELTARKRRAGRQPISKRNSFVEWNRDAEIYAFNQRLTEKFDIKKLDQAFIHKAYVEDLDKKEYSGDDYVFDIEDNEKFIEKGEEVTSQFITKYLSESLPLLPESGRMTLHDYLMSEALLAKASLHLGTKDIILTSEHPVSEETMARTFLALVGALAESVNDDHAGVFVKDFLIAGLVDQDLNEIWTPENPFEMLCELMSKENKGSVEARLIGRAGTNTILSAYHIGIFADKQYLGSGCGQTVEEAKSVAACNILSKMFGISDSSQPLRF